MNSRKVYPKHIYEPIREEIATSYIKHEFRKFFPKVTGVVWKDIDKDIDQWFDKNESVGGPRNFWNGFHGIAMGFKLKHTFLQVLTAENIKWRFEEKFPLNNKIATGGPLMYISDELSQDRPRATEIKEFFGKNPRIAEKWKKEFSRQANIGEPRDHLPIIAKQELDKRNEIYSIHEGNRRAILAILKGKKHISAYLGDFTTKVKIPQNYWIPTSILMDNLFFAKRAYDQKDRRLFNYYMSVLRDMLDKSDSAVYEMKERAITSQQPFRGDVLKALGLFNNN